MLSEAEADVQHRVSGQTLREAWLGRNRSRPQLQHDVYTFADGFCGAGGVSYGAKMAGLQVKYAFDKCALKILTYRLNYPECKSQIHDVNVFILHARRRKYNVDVLHLSFPCQPYSAANTRPNAYKNELNQAPLLAGEDVIKELRPRIVTIEETSGLLERHPTWFNALILQFTTLGFSVQWKILKCSDYGVPQTRKRLIIIAAAPGEPLPPFPKPTFFPGQATVTEALRLVIAQHEKTRYHQCLHDPDTDHFTVRQPPYNPGNMIPTITCGVNARKIYHPSGLRPFTIMELAALQTFPATYRFGNEVDGFPTRTEIMTQIGNAVPPRLAYAIFKQILKTLRDFDADVNRVSGGDNDAQNAFGSGGKHEDLPSVRAASRPRRGEEVIELD